MIEEHRLSPRTREEYLSLWKHDVQPFLGRMELAQMSPGTIRTWRAKLLREGRSADRAAKAYRLVRAILSTAVDDGYLKRNPCRVKGAGEHRTPERPTATIDQVYALADRIPHRFRVLVLATAFTGLRWGELIALRRCDVDVSAKVVHVRRKLAQLSRGGKQVGPPKSVAGVHTVAIPGFSSRRSQRIWTATRRRDWKGSCSVAPRARCSGGATSAVPVAGQRSSSMSGYPPGFHFHDLRHTGNQLAANAGASTRELMHRMGHGSMRAALISQHATTDRDRVIADALGDLIAARGMGRTGTETGGEEDSGSEGVRLVDNYRMVSPSTAQTTRIVVNCR